MTQPDATQLHPFIVDHFSLDELKTLCFNLGIEFDDLGGDTRQGKARELVKAMQRQTRLDHLAAHLSLARPDAYRQRFHQSPTIPATPARLHRNPRQVFVSHAHQDEAFARRLADDLRQRGFPVWIAPDSIRIGEDWPDAIDRGLDESGVIVVALTPDALTSYWVRKEASTARLLAGKNLVQFALLDVADCEAPSSWYTYQNVSFRGAYQTGLDELLRWLRYVPVMAPVGQGVIPHPPAQVFHPARRIHEKTGIELIRIPAGPFLYGSADRDEMAFDNEKPQRTVELPEYWIGRYPVTNKQYKRFLDANPEHRVPFVDDHYSKPYNWNDLTRTYPLDMADHPVVLVDWFDGKAFCDWAGLQLPTEEEWEKAARGTDGRMWPWGNASPTVERCNFDRNIGGTTPVGKYSPQGDSPYDCADMAGNVWEWTGSWYDEGQTFRVLRGGSWLDYQRFARVSIRNRNTPDLANLNFGFRVAAPVGSGS